MHFGIFYGPLNKMPAPDQALKSSAVCDLSSLKPATQEAIKGWLADGTFTQRAIGALQDQERENMRLEALVAEQASRLLNLSKPVSRADILKALVNCPHSIDASSVTLEQDAAQGAGVALAQITDRLLAILAPLVPEASKNPENAVANLADAPAAEPARQLFFGSKKAMYRCMDCNHEQFVSEHHDGDRFYAGSGADWCDSCDVGKPVRVQPEVLKVE